MDGAWRYARPTAVALILVALVGCGRDAPIDEYGDRNSTDASDRELGPAISVTVCEAQRPWCSPASDVDVVALEAALSDDEAARGVDPRTSDEAYEAVLDAFGEATWDLLGDLGPDDLPRGFLVLLDDDADVEAAVERYRHLEHVDRVTVLHTGGPLPTEATLEERAAAGRLELVVFLCDDRAACPPAPDEELDALRAELEADEQLADVWYEDEQAAYERGTVLFADDPDLLAVLEPGLLPPAFRATVLPEADLDALVARYDAAPGVEHARIAPLEIEPPDA